MLKPMHAAEPKHYNLTTKVNPDAIETIRSIARTEKRSLGGQCALILEQYAAQNSVAPAQAA